MLIHDDCFELSVLTLCPQIKVFFFFFFKLQIDIEIQLVTLFEVIWVNYCKLLAICFTTGPASKYIEYNVSYISGYQSRELKIQKGGRVKQTSGVVTERFRMNSYIYICVFITDICYAYMHACACYLNTLLISILQTLVIDLVGIKQQKIFVYMTCKLCLLS